MNKRILYAWLLLLGSLALSGLGWWLKTRELWNGANILVLTGALLALLFAVVLVRRIGNSSRPTPMD
jgi:hypothetical protein